MPRPTATDALLGHPVRWPIVGAPMAGGPSNPRLVAAVAEGGGLGFLAAGYLDAGAMMDEVAAVRRSSDAPFGVNVFVPQDPQVDEVAVAAYLEELRPEAAAAGVTLDPTYDDGDWAAKLDRLAGDPVPLVSFTFGCPTADVLERLRRAGSTVVVTVTTPEEAATAEARGADAVCAQGIEAGGHQGSFDDAEPTTPRGTLQLVAAVHRQVGIPVVAAGGLMTGAQASAALAAGAVGIQLGTALLRSPESGAPAFHKQALVDRAFAATALTRAFTGRRARGLVNDFMRAHPDAPSAYPAINNATRDLRRQAVARGDAHGTNLWAGEGYAAAQAQPAARIVEGIGRALD